MQKPLKKKWPVKRIESKYIGRTCGWFWFQDGRSNPKEPYLMGKIWYRGTTLEITIHKNRLKGQRRGDPDYIGYLNGVTRRKRKPKEQEK